MKHALYKLFICFDKVRDENEWIFSEIPAMTIAKVLLNAAVS